MALENEVIERFCQYLRIKTVQPNPDYGTAVKFLEAQATEMGLKFTTVWVTDKNPVVLMHWAGREPDLPAILLNSHTDVVPVFEEHWSCDPFAAQPHPDGRIIARGSQDMKCVGMQYLEAIRALQGSGFTPRRSIYLTYVPDEEIGSIDGMQKFLLTDQFKQLNIGCVLDEGIANPENCVKVFYGERQRWIVDFHCKGASGHGSSYVEDSAMNKLSAVLAAMCAYNEAEHVRLTSDPSLAPGDVTTLNLTMINGGVQSNVIPDCLTARYDCRVSLALTGKDFQRQMEDVCARAGSNTTCQIEQREENYEKSSVDPQQSPWWKCIADTFDSLGIKYATRIFPAATDARFLRRLGLPCYGISPLYNIPILLHDHDEYITKDLYLHGVEFYTKLVHNLSANV